MRQAGIVAAAGLVALRDGPGRLALDHAKADQLAAGLAALAGFEVLSLATNMVFLGFDPAWRESLACWLERHGVLVFAECPMRLVTHGDVPEAAIPAVIDAFAAFSWRHEA
jgi:threonine aldolase